MLYVVLQTPSCSYLYCS